MPPCPSPPSLPAMIGITFPEPHTAHLLILCNTFAVRRDSGELFYTISQLHFHITKYHKKELNQTLPPIALCSTYDQLAPFLNKPSVLRHLNLKTAQVNIQQNNWQSTFLILWIETSGHYYSAVAAAAILVDFDHFWLSGLTFSTCLRKKILLDMVYTGWFF